MKRFLTVIIVLSLTSIPLFGAPAPVNVAYVMVHNAPLYQDNPDKTLKFLESLTIGDLVTLLNKTATFKESGTDRDFTRIRAPSGKEGWVRTQFIASNAALAVVKNMNAPTFTEPRDVKAAGKSIPQMTVVAVMRDGSTAEFARVRGYDNRNGVLFTDAAYMMFSDLSTSASDVQAAILYTVAAASKNEDVKKTMLRLALSNNPSPFAIAMIETALGLPEKTSTQAAQAAGTMVLIRASSTLPPETATRYRYDAELVLDGNPLTAWIEGSAGSGVGETIEIMFPSMRFDEIDFMPGFFDERWFKSNARVKEMRIELVNDDGNFAYEGVTSFADEMVEQHVSVPESTVKRAVFTINAVYAPEMKDLAISEISFRLGGAKLAIRSGEAVARTSTTPARPMLAAGTGFTIALKADGTVWTWGLNGSGQLGDGTFWAGGSRAIPAKVAGLSGVTTISSGDEFTAALKGDGTVWTWGWNQSGQLGDGTKEFRTFPVQVVGLYGVEAIAVGNEHAVALKTDGTIWAWGWNEFWQPRGASPYNFTPTQVGGLSGVAAIAAGGNHVVALKADGTVWAWGNNYYGQLGDGTKTDRSSPVQVAGLSGVAAISAAYGYTAALKTDGTVWVWGWNRFGQLGDGTKTDRSSPVWLAKLSGIIAISTDGNHTAVLRNDHTVWTWGLNEHGELGDGTKTDRLTPVQVVGLSGVTAIATGMSHTVALKADGTVWAWGDNEYNQLGDETKKDRSSPEVVRELRLW